MSMIFLTVLINVAAISVWSVVTGQNGFKEAAKMLRGEPAFTTTSISGGKRVSGKRITGGGKREISSDPITPIPSGGDPR